MTRNVTIQPGNPEVRDDLADEDHDDLADSLALGVRLACEYGQERLRALQRQKQVTKAGAHIRSRLDLITTCGGKGSQSKHYRVKFRRRACER
jgi:hypothetical protein